jgi:hypothetical protein
LKVFHSPLLKVFTVESIILIAPERAVDTSSAPSLKRALDERERATSGCRPLVAFFKVLRLESRGRPP